MLFTHLATVGTAEQSGQEETQVPLSPAHLLSAAEVIIYPLYITHLVYFFDTKQLLLQDILWQGYIYRKSNN
jgi:hypothetical protein